MIDSQVLADLKAKYVFEEVYNISDFFKLPSSTLFKLLYNNYKPYYEHNERIVFTCFDSLDSEHIDMFINKLKEYLTFIDISDNFILLATNKTSTPWLVNSNIEHKYYNIPVTNLDTNFTAILSPPQSICAQPWISLDISPIGEFKPCCFFKGNIKDDCGVPFNASKDTFSEVYNSTYMNKFREDFRQGVKRVECSRCWSEERDGAESKRQLLKHRFKPESYDANWEQDDISNLKFISLALGNICNLKCRICNPQSSSQIALESIQQSKQEIKKLHPNYQWLKQGQWVNNSESLVWDELAKYPVIHYDINGGEPLLTLKHFDMLAEIVKQGRAKEVSLHYNTNCTIFPDEYIDIWRNFKLVDIVVSIDDIGERFELERSNAVWDDVYANLQKFLALKSDVFKIGLNLAVNILNAPYLPEICDFVEKQNFDTIHFHTLYYPELLSVKNLTVEAKDLILSKLVNYKNNNNVIDMFVRNVENTVQTCNIVSGIAFVEYMKTLDQYRNEDLSKTHFAIAKAMGYTV